MDNPQSTHSTFVTGVAWAFILLAGFAALTCLLQSIMIAMMFGHGTAQQVPDSIDTHVGEFGQLVLSHIRAIFLALLLVFVTTLVTAIGVLKRSNAARIVFIGLMGFGVVWNVTTAVLLYYFLPLMPDVITNASPPLWPSNLMRNVIFVFGLALSIGCIGLFWWIGRCLVSDEVRREFC